MPVTHAARTWAIRIDDTILHRRLRTLLQQNREPHGIWVFAYGALLWDNPLRGVEHRRAVVYGYHRRFCIWQWAYRGTLDNPCLMLALDRGGCCVGSVVRVEDDDLHARLWPSFKAEMDGGAYRAVWVRTHTRHGPVRALAFVIDRLGERYAGRLADDEVAERIANGCGEDGACAQYLMKTVNALHQGGVRDAYLSKLDAMVSSRLART